MTRYLKESSRLYREALGRGGSIFRAVFTVLAWMFTAATFVKVMAERDYANVWICIVTVFMVLLPVAVEVLLRFRMRFYSFLIAITYTVCPLIGEAWKMYFLTSWWDKFLHLLGGFVFAVVGIHIFRSLGVKADDAKKRFLCFLFAFCFSMTLSVVWEFTEYAVDVFAGTDMQTDTVVHEINSYTLGEDPRTLEKTGEIEDASVGGKDLGVGGYLDIGLHDTMIDMLVEGAGALATSAVHLASRGKIRLVEPFGEETGGDGDGKDPEDRDPEKT